MFYAATLSPDCKPLEPPTALVFMAIGQIMFDCTPEAIMSRELDWLVLAIQIQPGLTTCKARAGWLGTNQHDAAGRHGQIQATYVTGL